MVTQIWTIQICIVIFKINLKFSVKCRGAKQEGGGVGESQPPLNFGWGVEHLSTPLILRKKNLGGVGSP